MLKNFDVGKILGSWNVHLMDSDGYKGYLP
jgi:hypothetical protein